MVKKGGVYSGPSLLPSPDPLPIPLPFFFVLLHHPQNPNPRSLPHREREREREREQAMATAVTIGEHQRSDTEGRCPEQRNKEEEVEQSPATMRTAAMAAA